MRKLTSRIVGALIILFVFLFSKAGAQCVFNSSDGYSVTVTVTPVSVIAPATCPFGYNYNLTVNYSVNFSGTNIPSNLYTLQGNIYCGSDVHFFSLPLTGGTGTVNTVSNPYRTTTDCATATVTSLACNTSQIIIQGPGLPLQNSACGAGGPLSIVLTKFNARIMGNNSVYLYWETASETANQFFVVERSSDGIVWQGVKTIAGAGNSSSALQYFYVDAHLNTGKYYYRLKQVNTTGTFSYSNIVSALIESNNTDIYVSDVSGEGDQLFIGGITNINDWTVSVLSATASLVLKPAILNSHILNMPEVSSGVYLLKLQNKVDGRIKTIRFLKK
jgi:hypothetical protein